MPRIFLKNIITVSTFDSIDFVQLRMISSTSLNIMEHSDLEYHDQLVLSIYA